MIQFKKCFAKPLADNPSTVGTILRNSTNPVHLFKVKSHAGIAGNECADAVTKYQATQVDANLADTGMPCAGINGNPFHDITWLAYERQVYPL